MPFRYVRDGTGAPIMPKVSPSLAKYTFTKLTSQGMVDLIKEDADKAIDDLF